MESGSLSNDRKNKPEEYVPCTPKLWVTEAGGAA